jgi:integrase
VFSDDAAGFARRVVAVAAPTGPARARSLLWACASLARFAAGVGLEMTPQVLLHPSVIERFIIVGCAEVSAGARRTLRTNVRHVARAVLGGSPVPVALARERAKAPYTEAQIDAYLGLADAQPTIARRMRAQGLLCLGAGAGLAGADLRRMCGTDVTWRCGGVLVTVGGRRARVVPVLARYAPRLIASAAFAGTGFVIGGVEADRRNVTTPLIASLAGGADLARLDTGRLRATWLAGRAERLGLKAFMDAAGITCSQRLGDLVAGLPTPNEAETMSLLGGLN